MRFFVPLIPSHSDIELVDEIQSKTDWIGFNIFNLMKSSLFKDIMKYGLKDTYGINENKKIFLTTTELDDFLIEYFNKANKLSEFINIIQNIDADKVMGPDWFVYEDMPQCERHANILYAYALNQKCLKCEKIIPNIHGATLNEMIKFTKPFIEQGINQFVLPGREYFINLGDRKKARNQFYGFTSYLTRIHKINLIVTGLSSPKIQNYLLDVNGFTSLGWLIQARKRRLISDYTYKQLSNDFELDRNIVPENLDSKEISKKEYNYLRAKYNLIKINEKINNQPELKQKILGECFGS